MPYCKNCGVEVEPDVTECPLCHQAILPADEGHQVSKKSHVKRYPDIPAEETTRPMPRKTKQWILWEMASFIFGVPSIIVLVLDLTHDKGMSWSAYPLVALLSAWILVTLLIFANRILWLLIGGSTCTIVGLLAGLDIADGKLDWFWGFGIPIVVLTLVVVAVLVIAMRRFRQKGMNVLATILLGAAVLSLGLDMIIGYNKTGTIAPTWSIIVLLALVPASGFLFYLHYRLKKTFDFRKFFRL